MTLLETLATMNGTDEKLRAIIPSLDDENREWSEYVIGSDFGTSNEAPLREVLSIIGKHACAMENEICESGEALEEYAQTLHAFSVRIGEFGDLLRSFSTIERIRKLESEYTTAERLSERHDIHSQIVSCAKFISDRFGYSFALSAYNAISKRVAK